MNTPDAIRDGFAAALVDIATIHEPAVATGLLTSLLQTLGDDEAVHYAHELTHRHRIYKDANANTLGRFDADYVQAAAVRNVAHAAFVDVALEAADRWLITLTALITVASTRTTR